jgi:hypothetical protein
VLAVLGLAVAGCGEDLKLPLCSEATADWQCWAIYKDGSLVIVDGGGELPRDPDAPTPRLFTKQQAATALHPTRG